MSDILRPKKPKLPETETEFTFTDSEKKLAKGFRKLEKLGLKDVLNTIPGTASGTVYLPVSEIVVSTQVRKHMDPEGLKELAESINKHGLINPITVRRLPDGKYELIAGHRRFFAVRDVLGKQTVECRIVNPEGDAGKTAVQIAENVYRQDLHPVELADAVGRVAGYLWTRVHREKTKEQQQDTKTYHCFSDHLPLCLLKLVDRLTDEEKAFAARVMDECGVSRYQLAVSLYVYALPEEVKAELSKLSVNLSHLRIMLEKRLAPDEVLKFARMVHEKGLTVSELRRVIDLKKRQEPARRSSVLVNRIETLRQSLLRSKKLRRDPELRKEVMERLMRLLEELRMMEEGRN